MWNYRVVRKRTEYNKHGSILPYYTYGIHEAYYDKLDKVVAVTKDPISLCHETAEYLRHEWVMMAEAYGKPILDYDNIPEEGHDKENSLVNDPTEEEIKEMIDNDESVIDDLIKFDYMSYHAECEIERLKSEETHKVFNEIYPLSKLIESLTQDYLSKKEK
jgi:hypothetical protein